MDAVQAKTDDAGPKPVGAEIKAALIASAVVAVAVGLSYRSSFAVLIDRWSRDDNYSHGWLIVPIALAILWQRRDVLPAKLVRPGFGSYVPLLGLLLMRYVLYERNEQWIESAMIPIVFAAALLAFGGWSLLQWALPGVIYLFFMVPLPPRFNELLAGPLQTIATIGSVNLLQAVGLPVLAEGNVILIGSQRLEVAEACRGLSMMLSFVALITAMVILVKRPVWERVVLLASTIPIAILCNIIRIAVTAFLYAQYDRPVQEVHDYAGLAMMVLALGFVTVELKLMSWLVVEESTQAPTLIRATYGSNPGPR